MTSNPYIDGCAECKSLYLVEDKSSGDLICTECGLVVDSYILDEQPIYRDFQQNNSSTCQEISIASRNSVTSDTYEKFKATCSSLNLPETFFDRCIQMFKKLHQEKKIKKCEGVIGCIVYMVCKQSSFPRSIKEIQVVMPSLYTKDFKKHYKEIAIETEKLEKKETINCRSYMRRVCSQLGFIHRDIQACEDIAHILSTHPEFESIKPSILAASIINLITVQDKCSVKVKVSMIAQVMMVAKVSVVYYFKKLEKLNVIPDWYFCNKKP